MNIGRAAHGVATMKQGAPPMQTRSVLYAACALLAHAGASAITVPSELTALSHEARIQYEAPGIANTVLTDPNLAQANAGGAYAWSNYLEGKLKGTAQSADTFGFPTVANAGLTMVFQNTGASPISFAAGAIKGRVSAAFERTLGPDEYGIAAHTLVGTLYGDGPGFAGVSQLVYNHSVSNDGSVQRPSAIPSTAGGFTISHTADESQLNAELSFPAFTLSAGDSVRISFSVAASALAFSLPGFSGWSSTTDYSSTGTLSMTLPEGTSLVSAQPLQWVSTVPEASSFALSALGLLALLGFRRLRRHQPRRS